MKKLFTIVTAGVLAAASMNAQAQVMVDGKLSAAEGNGPATSGDYVKLGQYPFAHGFGDAGLLAFYGANNPTKIQILVAGTLQPYATTGSSGNNSFQVFLDVPNLTGVPAGTALPSPVTSGTTPTGSTTSFGKFNSKLDQAAALGLAIRTNNMAGQFQVEAVAYRLVTAASGTVPAVYAASDTVLTPTASPLLNNGAVLTLPTLTQGRFRYLSGARMAYQNTSDGTLSKNPGFVAPTATSTATPPSTYGNADGTTGWEIELDRTAMGLATGNPVLNLFVQQNNNGGDYVSSDYMPNPAFPPTANGGNLTTNPDYTAIAGTQSASFMLATVTSATKDADVAAIGMSIFPNPASSIATVEYNVGNRADNVSIMLTDLLGRNVQSLVHGLQPAGRQSALVSTASVAAGTYLVRVQVGDKVSTRKVVLL